MEQEFQAGSDYGSSASGAGELQAFVASPGSDRNSSRQKRNRQQPGAFIEVTRAAVAHATEKLRAHPTSLRGQSSSSSSSSSNSRFLIPAERKATTRGGARTIATSAGVAPPPLATRWGRAAEDAAIKVPAAPDVTTAAHAVFPTTAVTSGLRRSVLMKEADEDYSVSVDSNTAETPVEAGAKMAWWSRWTSYFSPASSNSSNNAAGAATAVGQQLQQTRFSRESSTEARRSSSATIAANSNNRSSSASSSLRGSGNRRDGAEADDSIAQNFCSTAATPTRRESRRINSSSRQRKRRWRTPYKCVTGVPSYDEEETDDEEDTLFGHSGSAASVAAAHDADSASSLFDNRSQEQHQLHFLQDVTDDAAGAGAFQQLLPAAPLPRLLLSPVNAVAASSNTQEAHQQQAEVELSGPTESYFLAAPQQLLQQPVASLLQEGEQRESEIGGQRSNNSGSVLGSWRAAVRSNLLRVFGRPQRDYWRTVNSEPTAAAAVSTTADGGDVATQQTDAAIVTAGTAAGFLEVLPASSVAEAAGVVERLPGTATTASGNHRRNTGGVLIELADRQQLLEPPTRAPPQEDQEEEEEEEEEESGGVTGRGVYRGVEWSRLRTQFTPVALAVRSAAARFFTRRQSHTEQEQEGPREQRVEESAPAPGAAVGNGAAEADEDDDPSCHQLLLISGCLCWFPLLWVVGAMLWFVTKKEHRRARRWGFVNVVLVGLTVIYLLLHFWKVAQPAVQRAVLLHRATQYGATEDITPPRAGKLWRLVAGGSRLERESFFSWNFAHEDAAASWTPLRPSRSNSLPFVPYGRVLREASRDSTGKAIAKTRWVFGPSTLPVPPGIYAPTIYQGPAVLVTGRVFFTALFGGGGLPSAAAAEAAARSGKSSNSSLEAVFPPAVSAATWSVTDDTLPADFSGVGLRCLCIDESPAAAGLTARTLVEAATGLSASSSIMVEGKAEGLASRKLIAANTDAQEAQARAPILMPERRQHALGAGRGRPLYILRGEYSSLGLSASRYPQGTETQRRSCLDLWRRTIRCPGFSQHPRRLFRIWRGFFPEPPLPQGELMQQNGRPRYHRLAELQGQHQLLLGELRWPVIQPLREEQLQLNQMQLHPDMVHEQQQNMLNPQGQEEQDMLFRQQQDQQQLNGEVPQPPVVGAARRQLLRVSAAADQSLTNSYNRSNSNIVKKSNAGAATQESKEYHWLLLPRSPPPTAFHQTSFAAQVIDFGSNRYVCRPAVISTWQQQHQQQPGYVDVQQVHLRALP